MTQHGTSRRLRWPLLAAPGIAALLLAGCTSGGGNPDPTDGGEDPGAGFSVMVAKANDAEDWYDEIFAQFSEETGIEVEVIPYPADAYNTQVTTQLQGGNAADVMILSPGTGQPISIITLAEAGFLEPLGESASSIIPDGTEALYEVDGSIYGQPTSLSPVGMYFNPDGAAEVGVDEFPATFDELTDACSTVRDGGKVFTVLAGSAPPNTGLLTQIIAATRVYEETPDWNEQRAAGEVTFVDSGWADALETIVTMNEEGCFQDGVAGGTFDTIGQSIASAAALTAPVPGSAVTSLNGAGGLDGVLEAFPPAEGQGDFMLASANYAWGLNAASDDAVKASVEEFLTWVAEPENSQEFADLFGAVPITGATADTLLPSYSAVGDLLESGSYVGLPNATWPNPAVYEALGAGVQGILTGQKTVDEVLQEMDAAWDS